LKLVGDVKESYVYEGPPRKKHKSFYLEQLNKVKCEKGKHLVPKTVEPNYLVIGKEQINSTEGVKLTT
jgi:hypothetical protein